MGALSYSLRRLAVRFWRGRAGRRGIAAVELALASPMLMVLLLGTAEISHFISVHYRSAQMATTVADAVARYEMVSSADIKDILDVSSTVMGTGTFASNGFVILSAVSKANATDAPSVAWQCTGGGTLVQTSHVGSKLGAATLPGSLVLDAADNVVVAEVFYDYSPLFSLIPIPDTLVYKTAVFRPRLGALTTASGC
jgi:Flp pilus assembly protein TadG